MFGGNLDKINLYKLLLIVTGQQQKAEYDFVPYKFGCYSFSLHADLVTMYKKGLLKDEDKSLSKIDSKNYWATLKDADKKIILAVHQQFAESNTDDLMRYTYINYPYTAIRSQTAEKLLTPQELVTVNKFQPYSDKTILFTIGYEGISLEEYLNRLIKSDVKVLVDVRNNALSMKFGFSKNQLIEYCNKVGIEYMHIPQVGITSALRQQLQNQSDYDKLFAQYRKENLPNTIGYQEQILLLLKQNNRIALTCFESDICQCHRKHLAEAITRLPGWDFQLNHI